MTVGRFTTAPPGKRRFFLRNSVKFTREHCPFSRGEPKWIPDATTDPRKMTADQEPARMIHTGTKTYIEKKESVASVQRSRKSWLKR
ncbi:hypothetical protein NDU88_006310 [Pleurodeles waltl]|uniref:Uncharacterized protein n=1 Tax=Pleurodeles waltl TaxID=8319 RepID=A0AAV7RPP0_PLEWA|nr:hypothetical protein NDU88_006310 [Pleurodeles waltl]